MACWTDGCWDRYQVNICWHPRSLLQNTDIGKNPAGGNALATLPAGGVLCLQSTRNPTCSDGVVSTPGVRPQSAQYYNWAYYRDPNTGSVYTGWVLGQHIGGGVFNPCSGPALEDFTCGQPAVGCTDTAGGCGSRNDNWKTNRDGYIRYAPGSTAYHWVGSGASVVRTAYANNGYACVTVSANGKFCPDGTKGWIEQNALDPV
jgi:hypothetical protein